MKNYPNNEWFLKITAVFPMNNEVELLCSKTNKIFYFKFFAHQSVQSQLKVGDFFYIKRDRFHVMRKNRNRVQGLSGSLNTEKQILLFEAAA